MKTGKGKKTPTSLRLSDDQRARVAGACAATGLKASQILESALAHLLDEFDRTGSIPMRKIRGNEKANTLASSDEERVKRLLE
jgi:hypothetical protein